MNAFETGMASLFTDPNMAEDVTYTPSATGIPAIVRAIYSAPDAESGLGGAFLHSSTVVFEIPISVIADPRVGDVITWRGLTRIVQGEPERDVERLTWSLDTRPG